MKKVGVLLCGCGNMDGSEIQETVVTLLTLDKLGIKYVCMAENREFEVSNYLEKKLTNEKRNMLKEGARIARGDISNIKKVNVSDLDGLIIPGGVGNIRNLSNFFKDEESVKVSPDVEKLILSFFNEKKPIAAICISPLLLAMVLGNKNIEITLGNSLNIIEKAERLGIKHFICKETEIHIDKKNKIVTTPAYMYNTTIKNIALGIEKCVTKFSEFLGS